MNAHFGNLLKQELLKIQQATPNLRSRSDSTGSWSLSIDSTYSSSGNQVNVEEALSKLLMDGYQDE